MIPALAKNYTVIAPDLRGLGPKVDIYQEKVFSAYNVGTTGQNLKKSV
jgi:hypothetical protein